MPTETVLLIFASIAIAVGIVYVQYYYKNKRKGKLYVFLSFLRFITIVSILLLLINPKIEQYTRTVEKFKLVVLADNSSSIKGEDQKTVSSIVSSIASSVPSEKIEVDTYAFSDQLTSLDTLGFKDNSTNINAALQSLKGLYRNTKNAIVVVSDGNQTIGEDYQYFKGDAAIYPVVVGDTTMYKDLMVSQINANAYAFKDNKYPLEAFITYTGKEAVTSKVSIKENGTTIYTENVNLSALKNSQKISTVIEAKQVGVKTLSFEVTPLADEKNIKNNSKQIAIEVIDEKTKITIVSSILHPDLGALKKAIEANEQRSVTIIKPNSPTTTYKDTDVFILYAPDPSFKNIYPFIQQKKASVFTIATDKTDWNFLNSIQNNITFTSNTITEEVFSALDKSFSLFNIADVDVANYPPLEVELGEVLFNTSYATLMGQNVRGVDLHTPLWACFSHDEIRESILFGEGLWKWRAQNYRNEGNFQQFDELLGNLIFYLSSTNSREQLTLEYDRMYYGTGKVLIRANVFDDTYEKDLNSSVILTLKDENTKASRTIPMLLKSDYYEADIQDITAGNYSFSVGVGKRNLKKEGTFTVVPFNIEDQFSSSNYKKLASLAENNNGYLVFPNQLDSLISNFKENSAFTPVQKSTKNIVSLIDFQLLLIVLIIALSLEWFIRKYNGLI